MERGSGGPLAARGLPGSTEVRAGGALGGLESAAV